MKKVNNLNELDSLLVAFKGRGVLSNNFIMPDKYKEYISKGELAYTVSDSALVFLVEKHNHRRLYYNVKEAAGKVELPLDKPLVMELVYRKGKDDNTRHINYWMAYGFEQFISRARMNVDFDKFQSIIPKTEEAVYAKAKQTDVIHKLIEEAFDPFLGCVPDKAEVEKYIEQKEILVVLDDKQEIMGLLHIGNKNNTYFVWHLLVRPEARNKGIAKSLMSQFCTVLKAGNCAKIQLWVKKDNTGARNLYESLGFIYDGWESEGLIKI